MTPPASRTPSWTLEHLTPWQTHWASQYLPPRKRQGGPGFGWAQPRRLGRERAPTFREAACLQCEKLSTEGSKTEEPVHWLLRRWKRPRAVGGGGSRKGGGCVWPRCVGLCQVQSLFIAEGDFGGISAQTLFFYR